MLTPAPIEASASAGCAMSITSRVMAMANTASVKKPTRSTVRPAGTGSLLVVTQAR